MRPDSRSLLSRDSSRTPIGLQSDYQDLEVRGIPSSFYHTLHSYFNESPWSPDGRKILYLGIRENGAASICYWNEETQEETILADAPIFDWHLAASQFWALNGEAVVFRYPLRDGRSGLGIVELAKRGYVRSLENLGPVEARHLIEAGSTCIGSRQAGGTTEVVRVDLAENTANVLFSSCEVSKLMSAESGFPFRIDHCVLEPQCGRMFFKMMRVTPEGFGRFHSFWVRDLNSKFHCHGNIISGHPAWLDSKTILNIQSPRDGSDNRWLVAVDAITGKASRLIDNVFEGPCHPAVSPNGRTIIIDAFSANGEIAPIYMIDINSRTVRQIFRLPHRFKGQLDYDPSQLLRSQPHPAWSSDGNQFAFNCNHLGKRLRLYIGRLGNIP